MRLCPAWFESALTAIGGTNPYGDPIFKLVWSTTERHTVGGQWSRDGYIGYRVVPSVTGQPCWALMVWEPAEKHGTYATWEMETADHDTGLLQLGGYPSHGKYRLLKRFLHQEIKSKPTYKQVWNGMLLENQQSGVLELETYRMEPNGFMLDLLIPLLMGLLKLSNQQKTEILQQEEQAAKDEFCRKVRDARDGHRISRGSQMVAKRAELIEKGFEAAMKMAAQTGLGMKIGA